MNSGRSACWWQHSISAEVTHSGIKHFQTTQLFYLVNFYLNVFTTYIYLHFNFHFIYILLHLKKLLMQVILIVLSYKLSTDNKITCTSTTYSSRNNKFDLGWVRSYHSLLLTHHPGRMFFLIGYPGAILWLVRNLIQTRLTKKSKNVVFSPDTKIERQWTVWCQVVVNYQNINNTSWKAYKDMLSFCHKRRQMKSAWHVL